MNFFEKIKPITTFIFDMDGVLTDGSILVLSGDQQVRRMHVKDGLGLRMAIKNGYRVMIISGGYSEAAKERLIKLGIYDAYMNVADKKDFADKYRQKHSLNWDEILYMGDDLPDISLLKVCGLSACPADAIAEIKVFAHYISPVKGGWGCVRDIIEKVLKVQDKWIYHDDLASK